MLYEKKIDDYLLSNDKTKLQVDVIHNYLANESYWAKNIPISIVQQAIEGSECFAIYINNQQIGFARVITDYATFAYLADVFILEEYRSKGLSKELMQFIMDFDPIKPIRRFMLATKDAQGLYKQFGFNNLAFPERIMEIKFFESY
jgi:GNAT superfamily N-acetyltransferase